MFDIGFFELVIIFVLGLIVLGPERLPRVARGLGRWIGKARRTARNLQYELQREIDMEDLRKRSEAHPINRESAAAGQTAPTNTPTPAPTAPVASPSAITPAAALTTTANAGSSAAAEVSSDAHGESASPAASATVDVPDGVAGDLASQAQDAADQRNG